MTDEKRREAERLAVEGDVRALARVKRDRCRSGECCAHSDGIKGLPLPPEETMGVRLSPCLPTQLRYLTARGGVCFELTLHVDGQPHAVRHAIEYLRRIFPADGTSMREAIEPPQPVPTRCQHCQSDQIEVRGESGEFWHYCHACQRDATRNLP